MSLEDLVKKCDTVNVHYVRKKIFVFPSSAFQLASNFLPPSLPLSYPISLYSFPFAFRRHARIADSIVRWHRIGNYSDYNIIIRTSMYAV